MTQIVSRVKKDKNKYVGQQFLVAYSDMFGEIELISTRYRKFSKQFPDFP